VRALPLKSSGAAQALEEVAMPDDLLHLAQVDTPPRSPS